MRVTSVTINSNDEEAMRLDLHHSPTAKSQYIIKAMTGLDADELIPRFYGFSKDAAKKKFYEVKLKPRLLVMRIVMNPRYKIGETNSDIRDSVYKLISPNRSGELEILFHGGATTQAKLLGRLIKMEVPHFSNVPELQITIECKDPMFRGINQTALTAADLPTGTSVKIADGSSTAPHGFGMAVVIGATISSFTIADKNPDPEWEFKITPATSFLSGDVLYISTEFNNRYVYMDRSSVITHLLDRIDPTSAWPLIFPGQNEFYFADAANFTWAGVLFNAAYWGV
jgi:hypothetical protein